MIEALFVLLNCAMLNLLYNLQGVKGVTEVGGKCNALDVILSLLGNI